MADGKLTLLRPHDGTGRLVFGDVGDVVVTPPVTIRVDTDLPGLGACALSVGPALRVDADLPGLGACTLVWDSNTSRPTVGQTTHHYQQATPARTGLYDAYQQARALPTGMHSRYQQAQPLQAPSSAAWDDASTTRATTGLRYQQAQPAHHLGLRSAWQTAMSHRVGSALRYQEAWPLQVLGSARFQQALGLRLGGLHRYQEALRSGRSASARFQRALPWRVDHRVRYQEAWPPRPGLSVLIPVEPPGPPPCYTPNGYLVFSDPLDGTGRLLFICHRSGDGPGPIVIPARKVYFIVNTLSMKRVSDNTPIELVSASVGIDKNSWCWSFSGAVPYTEFEKVEPTATGPVEVELEINGLVWRLLIEKYSTKEVFAKTDISISGRSVTAWLDAPYAPVRSFIQTTALTSRQFAEAELTRAGLVTGFTLDWQLIDALGWQMPAYTWSYTDLTPVQVIQTIIQGAGGYFNSHPSAKELIIRAEYPKPFWEWDAATADLIIPESLILSRSLDWEERPLYNGVYVSGELTGVNDLVRRTGTSGAMQAPPFVGPMISDHAAARSKGIAILSASGKQARVGLELPMEPTLGLVTPGMLVQVQKDASNNWRGLVNSTHIGAAWGDNDSLTVSQSIELERHYGGL